ncbi:hypothetical protein GCM10009801_27830 [Streptomyces albiaxialis]|uniref:Transposase n=1 Tax=Streptomyces albiaxialis TaxID=329523 RepID=A0ABP5HHB7_9ACTN
MRDAVGRDAGGPGRLCDALELQEVREEPEEPAVPRMQPGRVGSSGNWNKETPGAANRQPYRGARPSRTESG